MGVSSNYTPLRAELLVATCLTLYYLHNVPFDVSLNEFKYADTDQLYSFCELVDISAKYGDGSTLPYDIVETLLRAGEIDMLIGENLYVSRADVGMIDPSADDAIYSAFRSYYEKSANGFSYDYDKFLENSRRTKYNIDYFTIGVPCEPFVVAGEGLKFNTPKGLASKDQFQIVNFGLFIGSYGNNYYYDIFDRGLMMTNYANRFGVENIRDINYLAKPDLSYVVFYPEDITTVGSYLREHFPNNLMAYNQIYSLTSMLALNGGKFSVGMQNQNVDAIWPETINSSLFVSSSRMVDGYDFLNMGLAEKVIIFSESIMQNTNVDYNIITGFLNMVKRSGLANEALQRMIRIQPKLVVHMSYIEDYSFEYPTEYKEYLICGPMSKDYDMLRPLDWFGNSSTASMLSFIDNKKYYLKPKTDKKTA